MGPLRKLVLELHRRSLWQVVGIYAMGSWLAYEVVLGLTEGLGLPDWVPGLAVALVVLLFPLVVATAFIQEVTPPPAREDAAPPPRSPG